MRMASLALHDGLRNRSRLPTLAIGSRIRAPELLLLGLAGLGATLLTAFVKLSLGIPGHHIIYSVFPMAFGFALVPRHGAGTIMGGSAALTAGALSLAGVHVGGVGAVTSLALTGPLLDVALRWGRGGWRLYAAFLLAGCVSNGVAFLLRGLAKLAALPGLAGARPFDAWWSLAILTYGASGLVAGLISAAAWFHLRETADRRSDRP